MRLLKKVKELRLTVNPLIQIRVSKDAILGNYRAFAKAYDMPIAPVLKSNAYGHGLLEIANILSETSTPLLVVDSIHEAQLLRRNGIRTSILIVGYTRAEAIERNRYRDVAFTITSLAGLNQLVDQGVHADVHIKFDTGMHRQGLLPQESDEAIRLLQSSHLNLEGICSHFADADGNTDAFTQSQIAVWNELVSQWRTAFPHIHFWHIAATAGSAFMRDTNANLIRLGTGLYGFPRHASQAFGLKPALSMHTVITGVKDLAAGEQVGYNCTFTADKAMRIATIPVGYFEGVDRRLSNKGSVLVNGVPCTIVGRVSMNITTIDVTDCPDVVLETPVTVFSDKYEDANSLIKLGEMCNTTPLELLVHIPQHLRRVTI